MMLAAWLCVLINSPRQSFFFSFLFFFQTTTTPPRKTQALLTTNNNKRHTQFLQLISTMQQPEQQFHPLDRKDEQKTTSSTVGEKISNLGEKLSSATLGGNSSKEKISTETTGTHGLPSKEEATVRCFADFAIYPMGTTASFHKHIDEVEKVLKRCGMSVFLFFYCRLVVFGCCGILPTVCSFVVVGRYLSTPSALTKTNNYFSLSFFLPCSLFFRLSVQASITRSIPSPLRWRERWGPSCTRSSPATRLSTPWVAPAFRQSMY